MSDEGNYGPKMAALTERQRRFVEVMVEQPGISGQKAAEAAGYQSSNPAGATLRVMAHKLLHDDRILAAIHEQAGRKLRSNSLMASNVLVDLLDDPDPKIKLKAAGMLLDRVGFGASSNININQTVTDQSGKAILDRIRSLADRLGVQTDRLLEKPASAPVVDAEFSEVKDG